MKESLTLELEVLNPRGEIKVEAEGLSNPRVNDLAYKKILLIPNKKPGANFFLTTVGEALKQKYPTTTTFLLNPQPFDFEVLPSDLAEKEATKKKIQDEADVWIFGTGD